MTTTKRGRGRPKSDHGPAVDLDRLLDMAANSFANKGYEATSVRELARTAGISHSLAHHYYDTKQDLWKACIDRGFGYLQKEMASTIQLASRDTNLEGSIHSTIVSYVNLSERFSDYLLILLQEASHGGERLDYIITNYFAQFNQLARHFYQQTVDAGLLRPIPWETLFTVIMLGGPARYALEPLMEVLTEQQGKTPHENHHGHHVAELILKGLLAN